MTLTAGADNLKRPGLNPTYKRRSSGKSQRDYGMLSGKLINRSHTHTDREQHPQQPHTHTSTGHTHTHTDREQHPRQRHTHTPTGHTHTHRQRTTPPTTTHTHAHDENNTPNEHLPQTLSQVRGWWSRRSRATYRSRPTSQRGTPTCRTSRRPPPVSPRPPSGSFRTPQTGAHVSARARRLYSCTSVCVFR